MLKLAALGLLLLNLLLLAMHGGLVQGWLGRPAAAGQREPERLARQVNPGALQLLAPAAASAALAPASAAAAPASAGTAAPLGALAGSSAGAPTTPATRPTPTPTPTPTAPSPSPTAPSPSPAGPSPAVSAAAPAIACLEAGPFDSASTAAAERSLREAGVPAGTWVRSGAAPANAYLVYMGRYADAAALDRKRDELRQLAVPAYPVEASSGLQPGLSLGRHASADAAEAAMAALAQRGVRTARVVAVAGSPAAGALVRLPAADAALQARVAGLRLPGGSGFRPCADQRLAAAPMATSITPAAAPAASR